MGANALQHFLIALLCLQSVLFVVDVHALHQNPNVHTAASIDTASDSVSSQNNLPCEHCCHCHGGNSVTLHSISLLDDPPLERSYRDLPKQVSIRHFPAPPLRPPILC
ncbi:MAG: hypothetical protein CR978_00905 [Gammaproteobacteria bacterium]|nr:MAG: hypothetical protein CR978_00905 [Gammaproteobacteria bacterium]